MMWRTLAALPLAVIATSAYAKVYLTAEQAQAAIFPGEKIMDYFLGERRIRKFGVGIVSER